MALIRWEPVRELGTIQNEMNRLFNTFFDTPQGNGHVGSAMRRWIPAMDLVETDGHEFCAARRPARPVRERREHRARGQRADGVRRAQGRA